MTSLKPKFNTLNTRNKPFFLYVYEVFQKSWQSKVSALYVLKRIYLFAYKYNIAALSYYGGENNLLIYYCILKSNRQNIFIKVGNVKFQHYMLIFVTIVVNVF